MAQTLKNILGAVVGSLLTIIFGWITMRSQLINNKVDNDRYEKEKVVIYQTMDARDQKLEDAIYREDAYTKAELEKIEQRYLREITLTREALNDIKQDVRDLKRRQ
jgi:mevalonate kinase